MKISEATALICKEILNYVLRERLLTSNNNRTNKICKYYQFNHKKIFLLHCHSILNRRKEEKRVDKAINQCLERNRREIESYFPLQAITKKI